MLASVRCHRAALFIGALVLGGGALDCQQSARVDSADEKPLREYTGPYRWDQNRFVYLQLWAELSGKNQLVAFDESGDVRTLYPAGRDSFSTGPAAAVPTPIESRIDFHRDSAGRIIGMSWRRGTDAARQALRVDSEKREDVRFSNGNVRLTGTLISPNARGRHPAIILVHGSGAEDREYVLPFARFLIRQGIAVLGYDKRGVGESTGDWHTASYEDLAGDVVAGFEYLKSRGDIDANHIGLLGWSQAGWVMPIAALRAPGIAFLISVSGAAIPAAETAIDEARNEMSASGMKAPVIAAILDLMKLQFHYAQTGQGWTDYDTARARLVERLGRAPPSFPDRQDDPYWVSIRRLYFFDPAPTLRRLHTPSLALFGELDDNILAAKNRAAWDSALKAAGNPDYELRIIPGANHLMLQAKLGTNAEMPSLQRFSPAYSSVVLEWARRHMLDQPRGQKSDAHSVISNDHVFGFNELPAGKHLVAQMREE